jgi:hypothetical protein
MGKYKRSALIASVAHPATGVRYYQPQLAAGGKLVYRLAAYRNRETAVSVARRWVKKGIAVGL